MIDSDIIRIRPKEDRATANPVSVQENQESEDRKSHSDSSIEESMTDTESDSDDAKSGSFMKVKEPRKGGKELLRIKRQKAASLKRKKG